MKSILVAIAASSLVAFPAQAHRTPAEEANKELVIQFYNAIVNEKDAAKARSMVGERYIQHNPQADDGVPGMEKFIGFLKSTAPQARSEIKRAFVDNDHVILHVHSKRQPEDRGRAIIEIFRVSDGKVVEHWDAIQDIPETSSNTNTMF